jgi:hypothetical protein
MPGEELFCERSAADLARSRAHEEIGSKPGPGNDKRLTT